MASWGELLAPVLGGSIVSAAAAYLVAKITSGPTTEQALTAKFTALIDRQEHERVKLERVAADLEVMVIRLIDWADQVCEVAEDNDLEIPPRPKFAHMGHMT